MYLCCTFGFLAFTRKLLFWIVCCLNWQRKGLIPKLFSDCRAISLTSLANKTITPPLCFPVLLLPFIQAFAIDLF